MKVVAHYARFHHQYEAEFGSLAEAVSFLQVGFDAGAFAVERIEVIPMRVGAEVKVYNRDEVYAMMDYFADDR